MIGSTSIGGERLDHQANSSAHHERPAALVAVPHIARAAFPDRPLRIMVGFAAGGTVDTIARILANALAPILGQNVVVENRPGGSASIAATQVVIAEPDGHTLLFGVFSHAVAPALAKLTYDTQKDLTAVSQVAGVPLFMFAAGKSPFGSVADAVAAAKAAPNTVSYATGGAGSSGHLAAELFARRAGVTLVHVPFRGSPPAIQSLISGDVQLLWDTPTAATRGYIEQKQMKALAVMTRARLPAFREIPAIGEAGLGDDLDVQAWQGVLVRAGTPPEIIATLHKAIVQAMSSARHQGAHRGDVGRADGNRSGGVRRVLQVRGRRAGPRWRAGPD